ncbi:MAG TPA: amidohydrolase family protein, partial [Candidatus Synoicihabitans sp.]|nr:amidohydrolase family protein [Candidatus Synoicihabitans sp.]
AALLAAGANLLLGTDNGMLNSPSILAELDFTYKVAKSQAADAVQPDPARILAMATRNIRSVLGGDHYGYLATGLPASFVVVDFNAPHLCHTRHLLASLLTRVTPSEILATYHHGRELWRDPGFTS